MLRHTNIPANSAKDGAYGGCIGAVHGHGSSGGTLQDIEGSNAACHTKCFGMVEVTCNIL